MRPAQRAALVCLTLLVGLGSARAALFDDEEARRRIEATNQRIVQLQRQVEDRLALLELQAKSGSIADLATQIQLLQGDIAKLRGQFEVVNYELDQSQKRQRDLYVDLDTRLRKLETAPPPAPASPPPAADAEPAAPPPVAPLPPVSVAPPPMRNSNDGVAEQRAYDAALDLFKRGDYQGSIAGFGAFVKGYPRSPLASSAQYWIGNAQYARRDFRGSIVTQRQLLKDFPDSSKAPDALLNIASAQADLGDNAAARRTLEELMSKYPKSEAATRARQRLGGR
ncbi:MAG: tol-pal system protein YbgF [Betaproteobacteria bacterium]